MPRTAQFATLQRASACDDVNSPEMNTTIEDTAMDREESMVTKLSHGTDAFMNSVHASQGEMNSLGLLTGSELNESSATAAVRPHTTATPAASLHALQEWEGYVTEIKESEFVANLLDVTAGDIYAGEEAVIPLDEISETDAAKMHTGSIFRWVIGYERAPSSGNKRRVSQIVFRDLPAFTKRDLKEAEEWAEEMMAVFDK